jgi:Short C-terminal domain
MIKTFENQIIALFITYLLFFFSSVHAFNLFGYDDEDVIWQSGLNRFIKYADQDETKFGKNEHPVELNQEELKLALRALGIPDDSFFSVDGEVKDVFTVQQIRLLSVELSKGFRNAKPDQDIIFALEKSSRELLGLQDLRFLAGRAFYKEGKLNIIMGEYDFFRSKAFESAYDPSGQAAVPYTLNFGKRSKASKVFEGVFLNVPGIENKRFKKIRHDWFVIDVKLAAESFLAEKNKQEKPQEGANDKALKIEAAKMAKQRREMRAEMARMRKEMQDRSNDGSSSTKTIEDRIATLDHLLDKKLITQEEYDTKRKEILNDI